MIISIKPINYATGIKLSVDDFQRLLHHLSFFEANGIRPQVNSTHQGNAVFFTLSSHIQRHQDPESSIEWIEVLKPVKRQYFFRKASYVEFDYRSSLIVPQLSLSLEGSFLNELLLSLFQVLAEKISDSQQVNYLLMARVSDQQTVIHQIKYQELGDVVIQSELPIVDSLFRIIPLNSGSWSYTTTESCQRISQVVESGLLKTGRTIMPGQTMKIVSNNQKGLSQLILYYPYNKRSRRAAAD